MYGNAYFPMKLFQGEQHLNSSSFTMFAFTKTNRRTDMKKTKIKRRKCPFGSNAGIKRNTEAYRKAHREYVAKWRADSRDRYSGPGRNVEELPERYRPKKRKGGRKK